MEKEKKGIIKSVVEDDEDYTKFVTRAIKISSKVEESICKFLNNIKKIFIKNKLAGSELINNPIDDDGK